jgi:diketogulonate reductase-like aldo/keto reductase
MEINTQVSPSPSPSPSSCASIIPILPIQQTVPSIGLGTFHLSGAELCETTVKEALKLGYRMIDTAAVYRNEQYIGAAIKAAIKEEIISSRKDVFITSKLQPRDMKSRSKVRKALEKTLTDLDTEYVDLYLIHWPACAGMKRESEEQPSKRLDAWLELCALRDEGVCLAIGVSNFTIEHLEQLLQDCKSANVVIPTVNQVEFHPMLYQRELHAYCVQHGIQLQAYASLGGQLSGPQKRELKDNGSTHSEPGKSLRQHKTIQRIASEVKQRAPQVLLRWALQHGVGVIPKSTVQEHLAQNIDVNNFKLSLEQMQQINELDDCHHFCWDPTGVK